MVDFLHVEIGVFPDALVRVCVGVWCAGNISTLEFHSAGWLDSLEFVEFVELMRRVIPYQPE